MVASGNFTRVDHPAAIDDLLKIMCQPGGALLALDNGKASPVPVTVTAASSGGVLRLDLGAKAEAAAHAICAGEGFRILAQGPNGVVRTPLLKARQILEEDQHLCCECEVPSWLEAQQPERDSFRATLHIGMTAKVDLYDGGTTATGWLRDLSLGGCLAELEPSAVALLEDPSRSLHLAMSFPDGTRFTAPVVARRQSVEHDRILCGFRLVVTGAKQEQQLWYLVREIERESARNAASGKRELRPSPLFVGNSLDDLMEADANAYHYPPARRLARCAAFLATQIVTVRQGQSIDSALLSHHAEQLVAMHEEDREGLLFALACLRTQPPLVRHGLAVATRWVDMGATLGLRPTVCKAVAAAGLVHDLGKALLPASLREATQLDARQRREFQRHVPLLRDRLAACAWLLPVAIQTVVEGANERLDGSGYPDHCGADQLSELARLAAVIDVVDAMGHDRPDRPRRPIDQIYQYLRGAPDLFDPQWVERYIRHFGAWPIGTPVRFRGGETGWVLSLDERGDIAAVRLADVATPPDTASGTVVRAAMLAKLGEPVAAATAG